MNCPPPFYENCRNALRCCHVCRAGPNSGSKLHYDPIEDLGAHPAQVDRRRGSASRAGRRAERRTRERLIRSTAASGALHGDGDYRILDSLRGEHKLRLTKRSIGISWEEYRQGRKQGVEAWFLTVTGSEGPHHFVLLTERVFQVLLNQCLENADGRE